MYYGITVGPIVKTLGMTNTPAGLWTASYMFSYVTKNILQLLEEKNADILTPCYDKKYDTSEIGSYPDHIIFKGELSDENIQEVIVQAKVIVADVIAKSLYENVTDEQIKEVRDFMNDYICITCVKKEIPDDKEVLTKISLLLDHVELSESFVMKDDKQFLAKLFSGDGNGKNASKKSRHYIKQFIKEVCMDGKVGPQVQNNRDENKPLKDIESICKIKGMDKLKVSDYYAIVYADGDNMSSVLKNLTPEELKDFSADCLKFTQDAAKAIKEYGGVTIYAGGDDLLFIAPLCGIKEKNNDDKQTVFELCKSLSNCFIDVMKKINAEAKVSLSFGISISFCRSPLYESLDRARNMLFGEAKNTKEKNAIALSLSKASGQSVSMVFSQESELFDKWINFLSKYYINVKNKEQLKRVRDDSDEYDIAELPTTDEQQNKVELEEKLINSALYMIEDYYKLFEVAAKNNGIYNFFTNMMDNAHQEKYQAYIKDVADLYQLLKDAESNCHFKSLNDEIKKDTALSGILRLSKFYIEKSGQN